jgi:hypothetical protein
MTKPVTSLFHILCFPNGHALNPDILEGGPRGACSTGDHPRPFAFGPLLPWTLPVLLLDPLPGEGRTPWWGDILSPLAPCCPEWHLSRMRRGKLKAWEPR